MDVSYIPIAEARDFTTHSDKIPLWDCYIQNVFVYHLFYYYNLCSISSISFSTDFFSVPITEAIICGSSSLVMPLDASK